MEKQNPKIQGLYAITDPTLTPGDSLIPACQAALKGGARLLQYRDKTARFEQQLHTAKTLKQLCEEHNAKLIINDSVELAQESQAHGVHLGQLDGNLATARQELGESSIIGVTCHNELVLAHNAIIEGADYVAFGRFFPSHTKPNAKAAQISTLETDLMVPKVAIGGVTPDNAPQLIRAGADAIAVIHALFASNDTKQIEQTAQHFVQLFSEEI